jgi:hypothetical protein
MFYPRMPMCHHRSSFRVVADAIANAISRGVDHLTRPKADPKLQLLAGLVPMILDTLRPPRPLDLDGPKVKQVRREFAAEEAHLQALFAEKRARLVADFGPRFDEAQAADDAASAARYAQAAVVA